MLFTEQKINIKVPRLKEIKAKKDSDIIELDNDKLLEEAIEINNYNYKYFNEDLYGKTTILSCDKLTPDELDFIVNDLVMERQLKKGHNKEKGFEFEAEFKSDWEDIDEDEEINNHNKEQVESILRNKAIEKWRKKNIWKFYLLAISFTLLFIYFIMDNIKFIITIN